MKRSFIKIFNENISYLYEEIDAKKANVLFIHGFKDEAARAISLFRIKDRNYNLWAIDLPGCGKSSSNELITIEYCAKIVNEFVNLIFKGKPFYIICHSMGAQVALNVYKTAKNIKHILMVTPSIYILDNKLENYEEWLHCFLPETGEEAFETQLRLFSNSEREKVANNEALKESYLSLSSEDLAKENKKFNYLVKEQLFNPEYALNNLKPLYDAFEGIYSIIYTKEDLFIRYQDLKKIIDSHPETQTYLFTNVGHAVFFKKSNEVNEILMNIIKDNEK